MKKLMITVFVFLFFVAGGAALFFIPSAEGKEARPPAPKTLLLLGTDEAAANTDVILFLRYTPADRSLSVMQIPRDTYLSHDAGNPKVNHIYPSLLQKGQSAEQALQGTKDILSEAFDTPLDGALVMTLSALSRFVDEIGGVPVRVPMEMVYRDPEQDLVIRLPEGETVLDGKAAEQFVRFRSGYLEGDLGRVDAQKIFLASFMRRAFQQMSAPRLLAMLLNPPSGLTYSLDLAALTPVALHLLDHRSEVQSVFLSLPGEAAQAEENSGPWYYVLNKKATWEALERYFPKETGRRTMEAFDTAHLFYNEKAHLESIYFSEGYAYRAYTADEIDDITIQKKE